ncbi:MAG: hypothetical protein R3Y54_02055 [Eubacteriales bacterium]
MNPRNSETIKAVPDGVYEGGTVPKTNKTKKTNLSDLTTDLQNNGYPLSSQNKIHNIPLHDNK